MQAQIVIKELSEITENKCTNGCDEQENEENIPDTQQSKEYVENKTVEVI